MLFKLIGLQLMALRRYITPPVVLILLGFLSEFAHAQQTCEPIIDKRVEHPRLTLSVDFQPVTVFQGNRFALEVEAQTDALAVNRLELSLDNGRFNIIPLHEQRSSDRRSLIYKVLIEPNETLHPGRYLGTLTVIFENNDSFVERFCLPVGSRKPDYLEVNVLDTGVFGWGDQREVHLEFRSYYPFRYRIEAVKAVNTSSLPCTIEILNPPAGILTVDDRNSDWQIRIAGHHAWASLLDVVIRPATAEFRITYVDEHQRRVEEKPLSYEIIVIPPRWLLYSLALLSGVLGAALAYWARLGRTPTLRPLLRHMALGGLIGSLFYMIFQLGGLGLMVQPLNLTLDSNVGLTAILLGLVGGWNNEPMLKKLTGLFGS